VVKGKALSKLSEHQALAFAFLGQAAGPEVAVGVIARPPKEGMAGKRASALTIFREDTGAAVAP